jgi:2-polyprenyl-3-methyl-5-hydroxy-6-metoxy-1,4-benzoquinol methylase
MTALVFEWTRTWARGSKTVQGWRERRYHVFMERCRIRPTDRIIDVGAGLGGALECFNDTNPITAVDLVPQETKWLTRGNVLSVQGDGTRLEFGDSEFDAAFSSSVIEHVPRELQQAFASEVRRVARHYFVQTPNRWFLVEPHYQLPLFQFLPKRVQRALNRRFTLGWQTKGEWEEINLLSARDLRRLFPDATIHRERVFGLTKSLMAIR